MRRMLGLAGMTVGALVVAAVMAPDGSAPDGGASVPGGATPRPEVVAAASGLEPFDACEPLLAHLRSAAATSTWADRDGMPRQLAEGDMATEMAADAGGKAAVPAPASGTSDTNVQVAGVDEPDLVETDGARVYTVADGRLRVVDVTGPTPRLVADVTVGAPAGTEAQLLLDGDRLLVLVPGWSAQPLAGLRGAEGAAADIAMPGSSTTTLVLFDVAGEQPVEVARGDFEGALVAGRGIDGTVHLVLAHHPQPLPADALERVWSAPTDGELVGRLQDALTTSRPTDWLPAMRHVAAGGAVTDGATVACEDVVRPVASTDTSMLQVLTFDLRGEDVLPEATTAVLTDARSVTATATELVVATPVFAPAVRPAEVAPGLVAPRPQQATTRLHLFDLGPQGTTHRASGEVPGALLNQFSMSLHDGTLRVATTVGEPWEGTSASSVTVLRRRGDVLEVVGSVGGLGRGETIHAVRFMGERAYVVTFRQTDPLYTLDLSDPTAPRVTGELKITGYSAYLHPLADGRLLGVGQEATTEGQVTGTQVSVFDVADPAAPARLSQVMLPGASSEAEWDHHAVLVHEGLVVLPYERWAEPTPDAPEGYETAAMVLTVDGGQVTLQGSIASSAGSADPWRSAVRRALVVDGRLVTVATGEIAIHDPATLATTGRLPL